jgi:hypothetical protein
MRRMTMAGLARFGYGTHGVIYLVIGVLAAVAAVDWRAQTTDARGALLTILSQPLGSVLLAVIAFGLVAFSIWSLLQCLGDTERIGVSPVALFVRAGFFGSSIGHLVLCFAAMNLIFGWQPAGPNSEAQIKDWSAWAFAQPWGAWAAGAIGVAVVTGGIAVIRNAWLGEFASRLVDDPAVRRWAVPVGRVGLLAQGCVFATSGCFLLTAAFQGDPDQVRGLAGLLGTLRQQQPFGWILLAAVAFGLVAYGAYGFVEAAYRKIKPPRSSARE